jgi:hypothetical protein
VKDDNASTDTSLPIMVGNSVKLQATVWLGNNTDMVASQGVDLTRALNCPGRVAASAVSVLR